MKIAMLVLDFPPEIGSAADLFFELAREMVRRDHAVSVITTFPRQYSYRVVNGARASNKSAIFILNELMDGIRVKRIKGLPLPKGNVIARGIEHLTLPLFLSLGGLFTGKQDVLLVYSPPLPLAFYSYFLSKIKRIPLVVNVQDLFPQSVIERGALKNSFLVYFFKAMERFVYRKVDQISVHSAGNRDFVVSKGANHDNVIVIPNWADINEVRPSSKHNQFSEKYNLNNKFVVSYAGIMSPPQGLDVIIDCAHILRENSDIVFLMVGDGLEKDRLIDRAKHLNLNNIQFIPMQPKNVYPDILASSDVCLVTLRKDKLTPVVPGKLIRIMSSGRPVIASVPLTGDTRKIVEEANCGLVVDADHPLFLAEAILKLRNNKNLIEEFGKNGRKYVENNFSLEVCATKYENIFRKLVN